MGIDLAAPRAVAAERAAVPGVDVGDLSQLRAILGLSRERFARLLDVSTKTVERAESAGRLPAGQQARARVGALRAIAELGLQIYTPAGFQAFLIAPNRAFDGRTALDLLARDEAASVLGMLAADFDPQGL